MQAMDPMLRLQVETAGPAGLVVLLYRGIERSLSRAARIWERLQAEDIDWRERQRLMEEASRAVRRALDIVTHLLGTLDGSAPGTAELAARMEALYVRWTNQIVQASARQDPVLIREILPEIATVRSGWDTLVGGKTGA